MNIRSGCVISFDGAGYSRDESKAIVEDLLLPATQPEHVFTMRWRPYDFVVWCAGLGPTFTPSMLSSMALLVP